MPKKRVKTSALWVFAGIIQEQLSMALTNTWLVSSII